MKQRKRKLSAWWIFLLVTWASIIHKSPRDHHWRVALHLWSLISFKSCPSWTPGGFWWAPVTGGIFHFPPWWMKPWCIFWSQEKEPEKDRQGNCREEKSRSNMKKHPKRHLYEQGTVKIAPWFLEKNRCCVTCPQSSLQSENRERATSLPLLDGSQWNISLWVRNRIKSKRDNAFQTHQQAPRKGPSQAFPRIPQSFWWDSEYHGGKGSSQLMVSLSHAFRKTLNSGEERLSKMFSQRSWTPWPIRLEITTAIMMDTHPQPRCPVPHPWQNSEPPQYWDSGQVSPLLQGGPAVTHGCGPGRKKGLQEL